MVPALFEVDGNFAFIMRSEFSGGSVGQGANGFLSSLSISRVISVVLVLGGGGGDGGTREIHS